MISISTIRTYMFCPLKLYFLNHIDEEINENFEVNKRIKELRVDLFDLIQRNIRKLKINMKINEIENILNYNINEYINASFENMANLNEIIENEEKLIELNKQKEELIEEIYFNIKIISLKSKKAMESLEKDGEDIVELFYPSCVYSYLMRDSDLDLIGATDKIEIINGHYYPILIKNSMPPLKGVWDGDAIESIANAILIEQEFNTDVYIGFIDYLKINERRPVIINQELRKSFFKVLTEVHDIIENEKIPNVKINENKCKECEYKELCEKS